MKKVLTLLSFLLLGVVLVGCGPKEKTFTGSGIEITLDSTFYEKDIVQASLYLESTKHIFSGIRESKEDLVSIIGVTTLEGYIEAVLANNNKTSDDVLESEHEGERYLYAYYTSNVGDEEYGYMLVVMEGENYFYTLNFGCKGKDLEKNKVQYIEWANTISVQ